MKEAITSLFSLPDSTSVFDMRNLRLRVLSSVSFIYGRVSALLLPLLLLLYYDYSAAAAAAAAACDKNRESERDMKEIPF